jgi:predicted signal transduction protein with EAL and GGDEF domain
VQNAFDSHKKPYIVMEFISRIICCFYCLFQLRNTLILVEKLLDMITLHVADNIKDKL